MGPAFAALGWMIVIGSAFVPVFIAAAVILRSVSRAFLLAATFTAGAFAGFVGCGLLGDWLMRSPMTGPGSTTSLMAFATAGAVAGGVLAVYLLGKLSKYPPWRRY